MSGKELQGLQPTGEVLGTVPYEITGGWQEPSTGLIVEAGDVPGTAVVLAPGQEFSGPIKVGAVNVQGIDKEAGVAHIELLATGQSIFTDQPEVFKHVLEAVVGDSAERAVIEFARGGNRPSKAVFRELGGAATPSSILELDLAA